MKKTTAINYLTPQFIGDIIQQAIDASEKDLVEALTLLRDFQNGCPLTSYETDWNRAMMLTRAALERRGIK